MSAPVVESRLQVNSDEYATVTPQSLQRTIKVIGTLEPSRRAELSSQTGGLVEAVNARPGDRVAEGAVLVQVGIDATAAGGPTRLRKHRHSARACERSLGSARASPFPNTSESLH